MNLNLIFKRRVSPLFLPPTSISLTDLISSLTLLHEHLRKLKFEEISRHVQIHSLLLSSTVRVFAVATFPVA